MEYMRKEDGLGAVWQWYDAERAIILDDVTGEFVRFCHHKDSIPCSFGTVQEALEYVKASPMARRLVIVRLPCIVAGKILSA